LVIVTCGQEFVEEGSTMVTLNELFCNGTLVLSRNPIQGEEAFLEGMRTNQPSNPSFWYLRDREDGGYLGRREFKLIEHEMWRWWKARVRGDCGGRPTVVESRFIRSLLAALLALRSLPGRGQGPAGRCGPWFGEFQADGNDIPLMAARCMIVFPWLRVEASYQCDQAPFSVRALDANELERLAESTRRGGCNYFELYSPDWAGCLVIERRRQDTPFPDLLGMEGRPTGGQLNAFPSYVAVRDEYFNACGELLRESMIAEYEEAMHPCVLMGAEIIDMKDPRVPGGETIAIFQPSQACDPNSRSRYFLPLSHSWGIQCSRRVPELVNAQLMEITRFGITQGMDGEARRQRQGTNAELAGFSGPGKQPDFLKRFTRMAGEARLARKRMGGQDTGVSMALFSTALEVLLGKNRGKETGITEAISRRGAALVCPQGEAREGVVKKRDEIKGLYDARSRLLHDGVGPGADVIEKMEDLVRSVFSKSLELLAQIASERPGLSGEELHRGFLESLDRRNAAAIGLGGEAGP
jgi:hypothetical protein